MPESRISIPPESS